MRVERDSVTFATQYYLKEAWADCAQPLSMSGVYIGFGFVHAEALLPVRILSATSIKNSFAIDNRRAGRI